MKRGFDIINNKFVKEISKKANLTEEEVLEGINNLSIDIYETKQQAFMDVLSLDTYSKKELIELLMEIIKEKPLSNLSPLDSWIENYDGIIDTPYGVAYLNGLLD